MKMQFFNSNAEIKVKKKKIIKFSIDWPLLLKIFNIYIYI